MQRALCISGEAFGRCVPFACSIPSVEVARSRVPIQVLAKSPGRLLALYATPIVAKWLRKIEGSHLDVAGRVVRPNAGISRLPVEMNREKATNVLDDIVKTCGPKQAADIIFDAITAASLESDQVYAQLTELTANSQGTKVVHWLFGRHGVAVSNQLNRTGIAPIANAASWAPWLSSPSPAVAAISSVAALAWGLSAHGRSHRNIAFVDAALPVAKGWLRESLEKGGLPSDFVSADKVAAACAIRPVHAYQLGIQALDKTKAIEVVEVIRGQAKGSGPELAPASQSKSSLNGGGWRGSVQR